MTGAVTAVTPREQVARPAPAIELTGVTRQFGDTTALDDVTFRAEPGQVVGLLGHNGAGKTTVTRLVAGLVAPTRGQVRLLGHDPTTDGVWVRRRLGVLPSSQLVDLRMTARENLVFAARLFGLPAAAVAPRVAAVLEELGLADRADDRAGTFSAGMRQRLALARVLLPEPPVLLLDEPSSALDPVAARELRDLVRTASRSQGRTVVLCTHDLAEAAELCDEVVILASGRVVASGPPAELAARLDVTAVVDLGCDPADETAAAAVLRRRGTPGERTGAGEFQVPGVDRAGVPGLLSDLLRDGVRVQAVAPRHHTLADLYFSLHTTRDGGAA
ncbi:ATP-binding cassette domain-containing protein [Modestobacter sp. I12A-02628]|uniref:ABC transporter ATP-binding protein n=1 Tax=Goekera deserti TaxID=2497753 RepID=A0A7K3WGU0_9ACTN|nr:ABC transporter ATP-binding protein [Goekera deserti]MPQ97335.1 ATP-binding cassette domain-containing protein [Goekera deserti]NDI50153.1 ATP-binding cassette domain-containing protein [Goekera deserti]NEL55721.1 ABC transporter ATP-binding protein [Goekera deserti]